MIAPSTLVATPSTSDRPPHRTALYHVPEELKDQSGGPWSLSAVDGHHDWPSPGDLLLFHTRRQREADGPN